MVPAEFSESLYSLPVSFARAYSRFARTHGWRSDDVRVGNTYLSTLPSSVTSWNE